MPFGRRRGSSISKGNLFQLYHTALAQKRRQGLGNAFYATQIRPPTLREKDMYAYMRFIVLTPNPIAAVENTEGRSLSWRVNGFGRAYFKEVLFKLTELVERQITSDMAGTRGALVHDG